MLPEMAVNVIGKGAVSVVRNGQLMLPEMGSKCFRKWQSMKMLLEMGGQVYWKWSFRVVGYERPMLSGTGGQFVIVVGNGGQCLNAF